MMNAANDEAGTRHQIVVLLRTEHGMRAGDLAARIGITEMAIRRHLSALERDGLAYGRTVRQPLGRPANMYYLTEDADQLFPKSYGILALDLLTDINYLDGEEKIAELLGVRERRLVETYRARMEGKPLKERVAELSEIQNNKGYMTKWSVEGDQQFSLVEYNCPIAQVSKQFPQVCASELSMFQKLLNGSEVVRTECLANGGKCCSYDIRTVK